MQVYSYVPPALRGRGGGAAAEPRTLSAHQELSIARLVLPPGAPLLATEACPLDIELSSSGSSSAAASPANGAAASSAASGPLAYTLFHVDRQPDELLQWFGSTFQPGSAARLEFPALLSKAERAQWHHRADRHRLKGQSEGIGEQRRLVIVLPGAGGSGNDSHSAAPSGRPALTHDQHKEARLIYDACQMAGGAFWSMSRGEAEALAASGEPLPADLQAWGAASWPAVVDRFERGQGLHAALREGRVEEALDFVAFDPKLAWHKDPASGGYPAHVAAWGGLAEVVGELVKQPGVVDQRDGRRDTPLGTARRRARTAPPASELAAALQRVEEALLAAGSNSELASFADASSSIKQQRAAGSEGSYKSWDRQQEMEWRHAAERGGERVGHGRARRDGQAGGSGKDGDRDTSSQCPW